ncbi:MAG: DNA repair protein RadC [Porphyromonadaceae bacterium]|nr:DNA repair protein RadC [Porphyromonadaceae bacterium]
MEKKEKMPITDWDPEDRPREKLMEKGVRALSTAELIAILIGSGNKDETAVELSQSILDEANNSLNDLSKKSIEELMEFNGIGEAKAISIIAALELGRRRKSEEVVQKQRIKNSKDAYDWIYKRLADLSQEEFWIVTLNSANGIMDTKRISEGGLASTPVDMRRLFRPVLLQQAAAMMVFHNHPSGNCKPSPEDDQLTKKIKSAATQLDIRLLDHLIVSGNTYYSYADEGRL